MVNSSGLKLWTFTHTFQGSPPVAVALTVPVGEPREEGSPYRLVYTAGPPADCREAGKPARKPPPNGDVPRRVPSRPGRAQPGQSMASSSGKGGIPKSSSMKRDPSWSLNGDSPNGSRGNLWRFPGKKSPSAMCRGSAGPVRVVLFGTDRPPSCPSCPPLSPAPDHNFSLHRQKERMCGQTLSVLDVAHNNAASGLSAHTHTHTGRSAHCSSRWTEPPPGCGFYTGEDFTRRPERAGRIWRERARAAKSIRFKK